MLNAIPRQVLDENLTSISKMDASSSSTQGNFGY